MPLPKNDEQYKFIEIAYVFIQRTCAKINPKSYRHVNFKLESLT